MIVRDIQPEDRERWMRLFADYGVFYRAEFSPQVLEGVWAWLLDDHAELHAVVAVDSGEVVGFAHYRKFLDTFTAGSEWYLDDLFVDPASRGGGVATALIEAVTERARSHGGGTIRWITAAENETAQRVYDRVARRTTWVTYEKYTD